MSRPTTFCVIHKRKWTGQASEACPWCEIERLKELASYQTAVHWRDKYEQLKDRLAEALDRD